MEVGRKAGELPAGGEAASPLEHCVCPPGTTGLSCQVGSLPFTPVSWLQMEVCSSTAILRGEQNTPTATASLFIAFWTYKVFDFV